MQTQRTLLEELKNQFQHGGMTIRLIFINVAVFLFIGITSVIGNLLQGEAKLGIDFLNQLLFTLDTDWGNFILRPWGIFTSIFAHFGFFHILMNMLMLYFTGRIFEQLFDQRRLLYTYILGGLAGGLFELIAHSIFPAFDTTRVVIVGASGSIMAIFIALAFYRPNLQVNLFGVLPLKLIYLALAFFAIDLFSLATKDGTAHFAHIGGALMGLWSIRNLNKSNNVVIAFQGMIEKIGKVLKQFFGKKQATFKVQQGGSARGGYKTDEEFNYEAKQRQKQTDAILDKIAKSGYESLTKAEKEFLFNQSKKG